ncbi:hypothetical protein [Pseudocnuella soli]|uniref:hypothetical protein n=1 Tax=Pseudocnuella soli TaxID=2502779 RepID=UPI00104DCC60|nr:hypothetical protein [Pseudocnuella soli]
MSTESLYLVMLLAYIIAGYFIAKIPGAKRRIDFRWTLFFSILFSPIAGYLFTTMSPLLSKLPPDDPRDKWGNILLCIGGCIYALYTAGTQPDPAVGLLSVVGHMGFVYYIATRSARNKKLYNLFAAQQHHTRNGNSVPGSLPV